MQVEYVYLEEDNRFPNSALPVIVYRAPWKLSYLFPSSFIMRHFEKNDWTNAWRSGIYDYHHYHSTTHEVLGVYKGKAKLLLGGSTGQLIEIKKGDVIIIPAGVAHKCLKATQDFHCVGAYPKGQEYDMNYGKFEERPATDLRIKQVPLPTKDPVFGNSGLLLEKWRKAESLTV